MNDQFVSTYFFQTNAAISVLFGLGYAHQNLLMIICIILISLFQYFLQKKIYSSNFKLMNPHCFIALALIHSSICLYANLHWIHLITLIWIRYLYVVLSDLLQNYRMQQELWILWFCYEIFVCLVCRFYYEGIRIGLFGLFYCAVTIGIGFVVIVCKKITVSTSV